MEPTYTPVKGTKFIGMLPVSEYKWQLVTVNGIVVAVNPKHPPHVVTDGGLLILSEENDAKPE